jgi:hypothetical protein
MVGLGHGNGGVGTWVMVGLGHRPDLGHRVEWWHWDISQQAEWCQQAVL